MKRKYVITLLLIGMMGVSRVQAQATEAVQLALNIEKLAALKTALDNLKKSYSILKNGYTTIKGIAEGNFTLHKAFLDGLLAVSPTVRNYYKIVEIIQYQGMLVKEYKNALANYRNSGLFSVSELAYIGKVYTNLLNESLRNLDDLLTIVTAGQLRMSDDERIQGIDRIYAEMEDHLNFLRDFNEDTNLLAFNRSRDKGTIQQLKGLFGWQK